ncbi:carboxylesterase 3 [Megalops cyprinoides]|uniref:carboxylesterase 3 n=1 Tax=Megalops cyprinoides TaxID=118141 RepID=UPI0018654397|nr:carboxylesterase 3 [Megalops cyprinoides]
MELVRSVLLSTCMLTACFRTAQAEGPVVSVRSGSLLGDHVRVKGTDQVVERYLGVPYARPPVGNLRLAAPQPALPWEGVRDARTQPKMCIQNPDFLTHTSELLAINYTIPDLSEDCLYLNIYAPSKPSGGEKAAVMVWIHGGGLVMGGAAQYDGSSLAAYQGVVVVIIQYRLGILGFLSTGDEHAKGNWGFLDQIAALQWVQENIESFGGDPKSVTIFGESAGGISVSMLVLSPLTAGLFHKMIPQSGVATLSSYSTSNPLPQMKILANLTDCDRSTTEELVQCMRQRTEEDLINATVRMKIFPGAVVDGVFLKRPVEDIFKSKDFLKVPVLLGMTNHEFGWILPRSFVPAGWEKGMDKQTVMSVMEMYFPTLAPGTNELIAEEYLRDAQTPQAIRDAFTEMMGDLFMALPIMRAAGYHRDADVPVYLYEYQHRPLVHQNKPDFVKADHADEVGFVFGACFWDGHIKVTGPISKEEDELCKTMMAYWANFARTGSPNGAGLVKWPLYGETEEYLKLNLQQTVGQKLKQDRVHFMTVTLPEKLAAHQTP